jgi:hypothetical protein
MTGKKGEIREERHDEMDSGFCSDIGMDSFGFRRG